MSNSSFVLRSAHEGDWEAIASLLGRCGLPLDGAHDHLATFVLATDDEGAIGCAGAELYDGLALLRSVAVAPNRHREGLGRALVSRVLENLRHRSIADVFLLAVADPGYFEHFGFRQMPINQAPAALKASAEFQGACPASATFMRVVLHATKFSK